MPSNDDDDDNSPGEKAEEEDEEGETGPPSSTAGGNGKEPEPAKRLPVSGLAELEAIVAVGGESRNSSSSSNFDRDAALIRGPELRFESRLYVFWTGSLTAGASPIWIGLVALLPPMLSLTCRLENPVPRWKLRSPDVPRSRNGLRRLGRPDGAGGSVPCCALASDDVLPRLASSTLGGGD